MEWSDIIAQFLRPLGGSIIPATIVSGFLFGLLYARALNLLPSTPFHILVAGWTAIGGWFVFRLLFGEGGTAPWGWLGVALLWFLFCVSIHFGEKVPSLDNLRFKTNKRFTVLGKTNDKLKRK